MAGVVEPQADRVCSFSKCPRSSSLAPGTFLDVSEPEEALLSRRWLWSGGVGVTAKEGEQLGKIHSDEVGSEFESDCGLQRVSR